MDAVDRAILFQLQQDGRLSNVDLSARVGLSPTPCLRRVRNLEEAGIIQGYHADLDPTAIGRGFQVLVQANMMIKDQSTIEAFEDQVREFPEIVECRRMFGDPDYVIWVATTDADAYERFYMTKLTNLPGVARMNSQMTMKMVKERTLTL
ncbi:Lrp/AsnC family transcriptional regulator [Streptomyces mirabilis]|uniref:Lrp/AsnC family transcriptional regulator n=2 Tax=Streptomyces TaxID=1883 RepID=UPI0036D8332A